jgi:hypothetical protein
MECPDAGNKQDKRLKRKQKAESRHSLAESRTVYGLLLSGY